MGEPASPVLIIRAGEAPIPLRFYSFYAIIILMTSSPDISPNFSALPVVTVESLDHFVAGKEDYKHTEKPIDTLRYAFMDEALELMSALPKSEGADYNHDNLVEEIGDATIMGVLIARNQQIPLTDLLGQTDLNDFQQNLDPQIPYDWQRYGVAVMGVYNTIDPTWYRSPDQPDTAAALSDYFAQLAGVAAGHSIDFATSVSQTMAKLETRTRKNHSVESAEKPDMPVTHVGRLLHKLGAASVDEILAAERQ
jgi:NTP pyrophosphatase (non-canonical NTP hydrolase)